MKCLKCNHELKEGMSFCPSCGSEIPKRQTCPNCGHEINNANSRFCKYCGARLANEIPDTSSFLSWKNTMRGIGAVALILFVYLSIMNVNKQNKSSIITSRETFQSENNYAIDREINENPPNWIEGDWAVTTSYGSFGVKFKGKRMWIVDINGTMRSGSYRYDSRQHIIYPDFEPTYYELDIINHRIYAGNGLYFHRI